MHWIKSRIVVAGLMTVLATGLSVAPAYAVHQSRTGFNDEYIFATTRDLNNMEGVPAGLKLPLFPVTIVLDTIFLPFAVIAGFVT